MRAYRRWAIVIILAMLGFAWMQNSITGNDKYLSCSNLRTSEIEIRGKVYCVDETTAFLNDALILVYWACAFAIVTYVSVRWWRSRRGSGD
jgi:hypothetical protein